MAKRKGFRPTAWDVLEDRVVLSPAGRAVEVALDGHRQALASAATRRAVAPPINVGALGDSYTDEYRFYPSDRSRARNWVEILATTRTANFGGFTVARRPEPRNQGFAFNWARSDSTSSDLVANQLPGLAAQVARGQVQYAWVFTGGNDFLFFLRDAARSGFPQGSALLGQLAQVEARARANFTTAVNRLLAASPSVRVVVATLPDVGQLPIVAQARALFPQAEALVAATRLRIQQYNAFIRAFAATHDRVALADLATTSSALAGAPSRSAPFGGTTIDLRTPGDDFHHFFLADGIHVGTVGQGLIANSFIAAVDAKFGLRIVPLSDAQIVRFARSVRRTTP